MATIKTEIATLIGRCRRVGWDVEMQDSGNAHKVTFDDGSSYLVHGSYSDRNAPKRVLKHLEKMGLLDKEQAIEEQHEADKAARLAADRKTAAAAGRKMAAQAKLTAKAAGPYAGPEEIELEWFLAEHPAPWMRWAIITPQIAAALMEHNTDNRPLIQRTVAQYREVVLSGHWHLTHQGMAMDQRAVLQDGQHRLQACIDADLPISAAFFVGMPVENFKAIDEGRNRSLADLLGKAGEAHANLASTAVRLVAAYREPSPRQYMRTKPTNESLYDAFKGDPERLAAAADWASGVAVKARMVGSALATARYLLMEANGQNNTYVEAYLAGLVSGVKGDSRVLLDEDDPRYLMRRFMTNKRERRQRLNAVEQLGLILFTWNHVVTDKRGKSNARWVPSQQDIPSIVVCRDRGRTASAVPSLLHGEIADADQ